MKIAFLNYYQKGVDRGLETFVTQLSSRFTDHQTRIFSGPSNAQASTTPLNLSRRLFLDQTSRKITAWTYHLLPDLKKFNPDIVFALNGGFQTAILRLWTALKGKKLIIVGQSGPGWDDRWNLLFKPNTFVCLTERQLNWAKKASLCSRQKFVTIPNGVDLKKFTPNGSPAKLDLQKPIILCVAAGQKYKRVEETIKAVAGLKKGSLLLLGKGPLDDKLDKLGKKLLGQDRYLHTSVPHAKMPAYYQAADLFTLVSQSSEAFGIVYLEAMASGLPVVATDDQSRHQIVGSAGLYLGASQPTSDYTRLLKSALNKNWRHLPQKQAQKFSWDNVTQNYNDLLASL